MMKHLLSATALLAAAFMASPASAQQARSSTTGYAMIDDDYRDGYRDGQRSESYRDDYNDRSDYRYDRDNYSRYEGGNYARYGGSVIRCESIDNRRAYCGTNGARSVAMVNRISDASCVKNRSWGFNGRNIWVDRGCRAEFRMRG